MAIAGLVTCIVMFVLTKLAFGAAERGAESGSLWFEVIGFAFFLVYLASIAATTVGITGTVVTVVRSIRQHRSG
jgi:Na+/phosphate symporter